MQVINRKKCKNLLPSPSLAVHQISVQFLFANPPAVCGMNSDHLVQMKNLKFLPDLPKSPGRKVACGDLAANNLKEGKIFSSLLLLRDYLVQKNLC